MELEKALRDRIMHLCEENHITINALATRAGMPRSTLKSIIYGDSKNTGIATIQLICDALNISLSEFFDDDLFRNLDPIKD